MEGGAIPGKRNSMDSSKSVSNPGNKQLLRRTEARGAQAVW